ncbi:DUF3644 domain-containing protein [Lacticaseibacillus saniviri]
MEDIAKKLVDKSIESFILGLEIYNKPTIHYRVEGFSFFVTNAWELMLKSFLIKRDGADSIYFSDNPGRTIDLSKVLRKVYTNNKDPLRKNLEKIIDLRNISTHFITEDYEMIYVPLFQANVINFSKELLKLHSVDITNFIAQNFLTLSISLESLTNDQIKSKYSAQMAERFIKAKNDIAVAEEDSSPRLSIPMVQQLRITKNVKEADFSVNIDNKSEIKLATAVTMKDPSDTYKYSFGNIVQTVNDRLQANNIPFTSTSANGRVGNQFNSYHLNLFMNFYDVKQDSRYSYEHHWANHSEFSYSQQLAEFILGEIKKDPVNIINNLKKAKKNR